MGYIQELRQFMGSKPIIMVGAGVLILNQQNRLLMINRTDNDSWGIPGGAMELGESLEFGEVKEPGLVSQPLNG